MQAFTVTATAVTAGLKVLQDPWPHVLMGEPPEDGSAWRIPIAPDDFEEGITTIYNCDVIIRRNKKRMFVPEEEPSKAALVVADIRGKVGDRTVWTPSLPAPSPCSLRGYAGGTGQVCPMCGIPYLKGHHPEDGYVMDYGQFPPGRIETLGRFWIRYGGKRKPPWAVVYLLRMWPGSTFRVYRGNVSDGLRERFVRWNQGKLVLGSREEILGTE